MTNDDIKQKAKQKLADDIVDQINRKNCSFLSIYDAVSFGIEDMLKKMKPNLEARDE